MKTDYIELYTDYLISNNGKETATGLSVMTDNEVSHDQITRFLLAYQELLLLKGA